MKMDVLDTATSGAQIAGNLKKRSRFFSSKVLSSAIEHLPSVDAQRLRTEKYVALAFLIPLNCVILYMFSSWSTYFWYLLPILLLQPVVDIVEITFVLVFVTRRYLNPRQSKIPETPENMVYLLCCYNESYAEMMISLNSLAEQKSLDAHKKSIIVVCDGRVSSKGMPKTAAAHLKEDIVEKPSSAFMKQGYTAWDGSPMDIEIIKGEFRGIPIVCVIKEENRGKRDGIVLFRSFLHKFNQRKSNPSLAMISPELFVELSGFLEKASIQSVDYAVGIDADTRFDHECVFNLMKTVREDDQIVGVTGYIRPDPRASGRFSFAYIYQNADWMLSITSSQRGNLRRLHLGQVWLLSQGFRWPVSNGSLHDERRQRSHLPGSLRVLACPNASVPLCASVHYSAVHSSDTLLLSRRSTGYIERVAAISSVMKWVVNPALFISKRFRCIDPQTLAFMYFCENFRLIYDLVVVMMTTDSLVEKAQTLLGIVAYGMLAPFVNISTQIYTIYKLDDFRWGKTRIGVVSKEQ